MQETSIDHAIAAFQTGEPVLIRDDDDREAETDLLFPAGSVTTADVSRLRNDGGGLLFVAVSDNVARVFDLPFLHDALDHPTTEYDDVGYDTRPSFSLTVNHQETYTGITDADRALTISSLGTAAREPEAFDFAAEFRSPGHVHVLRAAHGSFAERQGHTELGIALAEAAGIPPAVAGCEMLDDESGGALSKADARAYATRHDIPFVSGEAILQALG